MNAELDEVVRGLRDPEQKRLSPKWFYDAEGSRLFDRITELDAYYLTRAELAIMDASVHEMARGIGANARLVEFGSGSSVKTRWLLRALESPVCYVPLDISKQHLLEAAEGLEAEFPGLVVQPVVADYLRPITLPEPPRAPTRTAAFFSGSTIGNFEPDDAASFLRRARSLVGDAGALLIAVDMAKPKDVLERAYDDPEGVTAAFNRNALRHLNRRFEGTFDLDRFEHVARYDAERGRVEMHLRSVGDQTVQLGGHTISFSDGETIHSESSYKWSPDAFDAMLAGAGFEAVQSWTDDRGWFRVVLAEAR